MTRARIEPSSFDQGRCKNDTFTLSATLPTKIADFWAEADKPKPKEKNCFNH